MRIATWNVNSDQAADRKPGRLAARAAARHRLPAGDQVRGRRLPARGLRGARLQRGRPRPEDLQRRGDPLEIPVRRSDAPAARRSRRTTTPASSRRWCRPAPGALRVASIYLPNGNPPNTDKYSYKLKWMKRLLDYSRERLELEEPLVLAGDYNVIPSEIDVHNPELWVERRAVPAADPRELPRA